MKILVTGASRGLGLHLANYLNQAHVVTGCARSKITDPKFAYRDGIDFENIETFRQLDPILKTCDTLINNAGVADDALLALQGEDNLSRVIQVNLTSTLILCKRYLRARLEQKLPGNIINISSLCAHKTIKGLAAYAASKAGLEMASKVLAHEMGSKGFRINCVAPGYLETEMSKNISDQYKNSIKEKTPLKSLSSFEDICKTIDFLISEDSKFITGQTIVVDGGLSC